MLTLRDSQVSEEPSSNQQVAGAVSVVLLGSSLIEQQMANLLVGDSNECASSRLSG